MQIAYSDLLMNIIDTLIFLLVSAWITKQSMDIKETCSQWIYWKSLEEFEYADNLAMLSHSFHHTWKITQYFGEVAVPLGLNINKDKTNIMRVKKWTVTLATSSINLQKNSPCMGSVVPQEDIKIMLIADHTV